MESPIDKAHSSAPDIEVGAVVVSMDEFDKLLLLNGVASLREELRQGAFDEGTSQYAEDLIRAAEADAEEAHRLAALRTMHRTEMAAWLAAILTLLALL